MTSDCIRCGVCCSYSFGQNKGTIITKDEFDRLSDQLTEISSDKKFRLKTKTVDGLYRCIALQGDLNKDVSCSIYHERPSVCSTFESGSKDCLDYIAWYRGTSE